MATRSVIAVRTGTARKPRYLAAYCHWDGYPKHQLPILTEHHNSPAKALELVAPGDISTLRTDRGWDGAERPAVPLYYHERGEQECGPLEFSEGGIEAVFTHYRGSGCEHAYVFVPKLGWIHTDIRQPTEEVDPDPADPNWVGSPVHY